ncbi:hemophore-related protein [Mycobacterium sp. ACS4331]|uniref:hemophore-related protein n=1 Tax=Mycobacterium sp. ACS4331 TaxID=1834121 RepID=UPI0007FEADDF|nr:hemophore-related protein [Mycobacterium sp. ACS4331]OBF13600.1 hypothetical protein A5727_16105 [Mycobacterium sp. ACS4331]
MKKLLTSVVVAAGGLAMSLTAGAGGAAADPVLDPIVNTTCNYDQVMAAVGAQSPMAAAVFNSSPKQQAGLRQFLAASPEQRLPMAESIRDAPQNQPYLGLIQTAFNTCNSF